MLRLKKFILCTLLCSFTLVFSRSSIQEQGYHDSLPAFNEEYMSSQDERALTPDVAFSKSFKDVGPQDWFYEDITRLVNARIIEGYQDDSFKPNKKITIAEFIKLLLHAMGYKQQEDPAVWYKNYIQKAKEMNVIEQSDNYNYEAVINRKTMAKMVCKILKIQPQKPQSSKFADVWNIDSSWISTVFDERLMYGYMNKGRIVFRPYQVATRAEACSVIVRILEYMKDPQSYKSPKVYQSLEKRPTAGSNIYAENNKYAVEIPILLYHHLLKNEENRLHKNNNMVISTNEFENHMKLLYDYGFYTITPYELEKFLKKEIGLPYKSVMITFDDGYLSNYVYAYPILKKYGLVATMAVITSIVRQEPQKFNADWLPLISWDEINRSTDVFTFASHTNALHNMDKNKVSFLLSRPENEVRQDLVRSKELLNTEYFAYPYGQYNSKTIAIIKGLGFKLAFITKEVNVTKDTEPYEINRFTITPGRDLASILKRAYPDIEVK